MGTTVNTVLQSQNKNSFTKNTKASIKLKKKHIHCFACLKRVRKCKRHIGINLVVQCLFKTIL